MDGQKKNACFGNEVNEQDVMTEPTCAYQKQEEQNSMLEVGSLGREQSTVKTFKHRLQTDKIFRKKFIIFLFLCNSFLVLGLNIGQFGPTLLDLQRITGCSLDQAAFFFNAHTFGYLTSSILTGVIFERINKLLQMFVPCFMLTVVNCVIPWCSVYEVMVTTHFFKGFFLGFIDAVANAVLLHLLATEVKAYMQLLHFMFAFGGIISPIISAPFLSQQTTQSYNTSASETHKFDNNSLWNMSSVISSMPGSNFTTVHYINNDDLHTQSILVEILDNSTANFNGDSNVYKAYLITAVVSFLSSVPFLVLYLQRDGSTCPTSNKETDAHPQENIPPRLKIAVFITLSFIIATYTAMEDTYAGFLMTFTVKHLKWDKAQGSFATSVYWTSFAVGRFSGIFIINWFRQARLLRVYSIMIISAFVCLLTTSLYYVHEGIWISSVLAGFGMSIFFPIFFSWTEEKFFHVDGKVTALIMTTAMIGVIVNPIILGRLMETRPIWFGYLLLIESLLLFLFFSCGVYIAKLIKQFRVKVKNDLSNSGETETLGQFVDNTDL